MKNHSFIAAAAAVAALTMAASCADLQEVIGGQLASGGTESGGSHESEECEEGEEHHSQQATDGHDEEGHDEEGHPAGAYGGECGGEGPTGADLADSCCGFPGDRGNELGVGQFCTRDEHCAGNIEAQVCSSFENGLTDHVSFFCTIPCDPNVDGNICGTGARCNCEEVGCGCVPIACLENSPAHCEEP